MAGLPTNEPFYEAALAIARRRHLGRRDQLGRHYHEHFVRVARSLVELSPAATPAQIQAALLHDAFEPLAIPADELERGGVLPAALAIIRRITLPTDGTSYPQFIEALCATRDLAAIEVELAANREAFALYGAIGDASSRELIETQYVPARRALEAARAACASPVGRAA